MTPDQLANSRTIMTGFMGDTDCGFKNFVQLVEIFSRESQRLQRDGDPSNDLRTLGYEQDMMDGKWTDPIVFLRDDEGLIGDGIHRGIAFLRCIENGVEPARLPQLLRAPLGSYRWPAPSLKQRLIEWQSGG
jgi:hypothetical protein